MTVVMAVRWGCRLSGLTVDTAEYKLYLQRAGQIQRLGTQNDFYWTSLQAY